jgi:nucleoredoxin
MRSLLIGLACLGAVAGGFFIAAAGASHPLELAKLWNAGNALYGAASAGPPPADAPGWHDDQWVPPTDIPAHPNWTWHMAGGKTYENVVITNVSSHDVTITHSLGIAHLSLDSLPVDVQRELQYTGNPLAGNAVPAGLTPLAAMLDQKLVDATGQPLPTPGPAIKYYAIYYGASWCPPCNAFTPTLVGWYHSFKSDHHDFELIFVSEDRSESAMRGDMTEMHMPWPAVRYDELPRTNGTFRGPDIQKFANDGIPDLVLVDASGRVLADSYSGATYVGPQSVVDYMNANLGTN